MIDKTIIAIIYYKYIITMIVEVVMNNITLFHGSDHDINHPKLKLGKLNNDYGQVFIVRSPSNWQGCWGAM